MHAQGIAGGGGLVAPTPQGAIVGEIETYTVKAAPAGQTATFSIDMKTRVVNGQSVDHVVRQTVSIHKRVWNPITKKHDLMAVLGATFTPAEVDDTAPKNATTNLTASFTLTCDPPLIAGDEYVIGFGALKRDSPGNYTGLDFKARIFTR